VTVVRLSAKEEIDSRPFASPANTRRDAAVMQRMLERVRVLASDWTTDDASVHVREPDLDGHRHWIRVPDCAALLAAARLTPVGFFGRTRSDVDLLPIHDLETGIVDELETIEGVLCYYDVALAEGGYGNLILSATPDAPSHVHGNERHRRAVALTPRHYHSVRLHTGVVPGALLSDAALVVDRTRYYDFDSDPPWLAVREFSSLRPVSPAEEDDTQRR
jgi:hypothetical protein